MRTRMLRRRAVVGLVLAGALGLAGCVGSTPMIADTASSSGAVANEANDGDASSAQNADYAVETDYATWELQADETLREGARGNTSDIVELDLSQTPEVFAIYVRCAAGLTMTLEAIADAGRTGQTTVTCDGQLFRYQVVEDPAQLSYQSLEVVVAGGGDWGVAVVDSTLTAADFAVGLEVFEGAVPANVDERGGVLVGASGVAGHPSGTRVLRVYIDFMCPFCKMFEDANSSDLTALRAAGDLTVGYQLVSNLDGYSEGTKFSTRAANAAATVADGAPEHFVAFVEAMFANQPAEGTTGLSDAEIAAIAVAAGVPQDVADTFAAGLFTDWVVAATQTAHEEVGAATPLLVFDDVLVNPETAGVNYMEAGGLREWLVAQGVADAG